MTKAHILERKVTIANRIQGILTLDLADIQHTSLFFIEQKTIKSSVISEGEGQNIYRFSFLLFSIYKALR